MQMDWLALLVAGLFEVVWAVGLKYTEGYTKMVPSIITVAAMIISFALLSYSLRSIPIGTAYAVWSGIGICGTVLFGMFFLNESRDLLRIACIALILVSIVILKLTHV